MAADDTAYGLACGCEDERLACGWDDERLACGASHDPGATRTAPGPHPVDRATVAAAGRHT
ncbi:hypothetical protein [Streptomyces sp. SS]|uniref:hypothetical protein n=1 Tax=Streptomyces sp. SS TaxID=260742 RepID=UPI00031411BD|nr:hypothetical protein [Streptomyces sp. SS]